MGNFFCYSANFYCYKWPDIEQIVWPSVHNALLKHLLLASKMPTLSAQRPGYNVLNHTALNAMRPEVETRTLAMLFCELCSVNENKQKDWPWPIYNTRTRK